MRRLHFNVRMEQIEEIIHVVVNKETGLLLDEIRTKSKF
jgi:hypothetical protein